MEHKLVTVLCFMLLISSVSANVTQEYARRALRTLTGFTTLDNGRSPRILGPQSPMLGGHAPKRHGPPSRGGDAPKKTWTSVSEKTWTSVSEIRSYS
ncbi:hypothetical protein Hanom_Chr01g00083341 [Helianthus anomalus]